MWKKGSHHTKITKEKIRQSKLKNPTRYWLGKERPKGKDNPVYGRKRTKETIENMRQAALNRIGGGMTGKHHSKETKDKIKKKKIGSICSKETKEKMRLKHKGSNNGNWKGGISKIDKLCRSMPEYKQWREAVFKRDNYTCQKCGKTRCYITAHHKKGFNKIITENNITNTELARNCKELWDLLIGITLCEKCHSETDNYKGRANSH